MSRPIITCNNLSHHYGSKPALKEVNFNVQPGEPIGLVGPNGAGKTTLLSILCGFLRPTSGVVTLLGHSPGDSELNSKVAALPQDSKLDPNFTIGDQLSFYARLQGYSAKQSKTEATRVLEAVMLQDSINVKPVTLSHGMGKRVAIAQALIGNPQLILLDEPTAGLDPVNTRNIRSIIAERTAEATFIISSHDLAELGRLCQNILLLEQGIMSLKQLDDTASENPTRFFTIQMESCPAPEVIATLQKMPGVQQVTNPQKNEFIVEYNPSLQGKMDLQIMQKLSDNHWQYRQINQGKTLEEKLFFEGK